MKGGIGGHCELNLENEYQKSEVWDGQKISFGHFLAFAREHEKKMENDVHRTNCKKKSSKFDATRCSPAVHVTSIKLNCKVVAT